MVRVKRDLNIALIDRIMTCAAPDLNYDARRLMGIA